MAIGALLLAIAAFFSMGLGVLFTPVPWVGALFSFGAPALAIAGIVIGGKAVTANKQENRGGGLALAGVITSAIALVPAMITALTCGTCNALCTTGGVQSRHGVYSFGTPSGALRDLLQPPGNDAGHVPFSDPSRRRLRDDTPFRQPPGTPGAPDGGAAEPALPPPPLAPGPSR